MFLGGTKGFKITPFIISESVGSFAYNLIWQYLLRFLFQESALNIHLSQSAASSTQSNKSRMSARQLNYKHFNFHSVIIFLYTFYHVSLALSVDKSNKRTNLRLRTLIRDLRKRRFFDKYLLLHFPSIK